jgi:hypothetical protein
MNAEAGLRCVGNDAESVETCAFSYSGCEIRLLDEAGCGLCSRIREAMPPEICVASGPLTAAISYVVSSAGEAECSAYRVTRDNVIAFDGPSEESVFRWLQQDIDRTIAQSSRDRLFVHAGVVGWRGLAILVLGRSFSGKSTLVAELVRRGALYYSDEFAILDDQGKVHPYARPLVLRNSEDQVGNLRLIREGVMDPLPIGLIISAPYQPGVTWRPTVVRGARAVLSLIDGTVLARQESEAILRIAARIAPTVVTLQGSRPEATEVAPRLLDLVDDALVSQALKTSEDCVVDRNDNIAAIAELRLRTQMARPAPAFRHLVTTPYVRIKDFLPPEEHQRVLDFALAHKDAFRDSGVVGNEGGDRKDYGVRKSQTLYGVQLESIWNFFDRRLRGILSHVRKELVLAWFPLGEIERQISAHAGGGFFVPHVDTGHPLVANRRISCVYYFYSTPQRFTGGELKLYDTWVMANKTTAAATCTTLMPVDNSLVFFPSNTFHEVCSVHRETEEFGDSRFSITIWFREGEWPASITGLTSRN